MLVRRHADNEVLPRFREQNTHEHLKNKNASASRDLRAVHEAGQHSSARVNKHMRQREFLTRRGELVLRGARREDLPALRPSDDDDNDDDGKHEGNKLMSAWSIHFQKGGHVLQRLRSVLPE